MVPTITAFADSPDEGQGLARDMRVRWAFEEVGQTYDVHLVSMEAMTQREYLAVQPFGQIPAYTEGDLTLFESGAIILHLAQTRSGLLPDDEGARARAIVWLFAALNTVEPPIVEYEMTEYFEADKDWREEHREIVATRVRDRLLRLSGWLKNKDWLENEFSAGDLMMVTVLRRLDGMGIVEDYPNLAAYVSRGEARPAYQRAFAAQAEVFEASHSDSAD